MGMTRVLYWIVYVFCVLSFTACVWDTNLTVESVSHETVNKRAHIYLTHKSVLVSVTGAVNVRKLPTEHSPSLGEFKEGDVVRVYLPCREDVVDGGWFARVSGGWVNSRYLEGGC